MFSCICPACLMEEVIPPKITSKKERNMRSGHPLTPSVSYSFLQSWEHDSLFTFDKYTINISIGISSSSSISNDSSSSDNESENRFIERNKINEIDQKP
ncbi:uncharacterized protein OCT59_020850 [Rhizophagus irregularis]|uniref:uncharacterized protein n=1 Tax=Rhizophagus irregularis TaxID=588596 RepID=UPI00332DF701|nr:hypothetical protein OCT59_020850 [Rhizophagus irregularis]